MHAVMDKTDQIRVLLADDHTIIRQGVKRLLADDERVEVCGEARDGREAVAKARELNPDVIIMDLAMPGLTGLDSARRIRKARPGAKVLVLSMYLDDAYVAQALEAGVSGYLLKDAPPEDLIDAVHRVADGEKVFAKEIPPATIERLKKSRRARAEQTTLTHREREVMKLLAEGNTVKTVAGILGLSQKTVDTHKTNLMKKLDIHNRVELVRYALNEKLIEL